jgi:hypothetical protein
VVLQLDKKTEEVIARFDSGAEASRQAKVDASSISKCCKGKQKTSGGFKWRYEKETN